MRSLVPYAILFSTSLAGCATDPVELAEVSDDLAAPAPRLLRKQEPVPGQYIVVLAGAPKAQLAAAGRAEVDATIDRLAGAHAATVERRFDAALRGFAARMTEDDARALAADPDVAFVEEDSLVHVDAVQPNPTWGLDRVDQASLPLDRNFVQLGQGAGATIYVIDTGIRSSHTEFAGRRLPGFTAISDGRGAEDCQGHGSHVSGTAAGAVHGVAKLAKIVPVRVFPCEQSTALTNILAGIDFVTANHVPASVANLSLGGPPSEAEDLAIRNLIASGVTTIVAAGNETADACTKSPAREPLAITVGATADTDARSSFSNFGACVDISAPGSAIQSADFLSDTGIVAKNGTSMAAPHVAGAAAVYIGLNPTATPAQVAQALLGGATPGKLTDLRGSPNLMLDTRFVDTTAPIAAIRAPAEGAQVDPSFMVDVSASDANLGSVELSIDGRVLETKQIADPVFQVSGLAPGEHTITVVATDLASRSTTSTVRVTVATAQPADPSNPGGGVSGGCSTSTGAGLGFAAVLLSLIARRRRR